MHVVIIGASRGCGLESTLQILNVHPSAKVTLLLRRPEELSPILTERGVALSDIGDDNTKRIRLLKGDALNPEDVQKLFTSSVDVVLSTIGATQLDFSNPVHPKIKPGSICTRATSILLSAYKVYIDANPALPHPHLIVLSSNGLGSQGYQDLPLLWKPLYGWLLQDPHADKEIMEWIIFSAAKGSHPDAYVQEFGEKNASADAVAVKTGLGSGWLKKFTVVRPAFLTDGKVTGTYRAGERVQGTYTISRKDIGHFVAERVVGKEEWVGKAVTVGW
ncbi:hypothetical protein HK097_000355 [Rhizophlyctis rosea]|uniref:NAD(P)-binding domain-containing protein n=1 Tax=Rhizophlyctis rosea TaxID=64517 RepID=A0AAD5X230_9FUNG|nr:hypothetical protein HK097_000355 [Rhizophlyctis rosea]